MPPTIYTQLKTGDAPGTGYTPRGTVIPCEKIESNMENRLPVTMINGPAAMVDLSVEDGTTDAVDISDDPLSAGVARRR